MKLIELQIKNFGCIDENGITIKIDDIVVLIGPNNVGKTTSIRAYEMFANSGTILKIDDFYQNNENNPVEIAGVKNGFIRIMINKMLLNTNGDGRKVE